MSWLVGDITMVQLPRHAYDVWHDRAVFHFLTTRQEREAYVNAVLRAVRPGGHVIVATFAEDGPEKCSGLPVMRYSADGLHAEFGAPFTLLQLERRQQARALAALAVGGMILARMLPGSTIADEVRQAAQDKALYACRRVARAAA